MSNQQGKPQQQGDQAWGKISHKYGYMGTSEHCLDSYIKKGREYLLSKEAEKKKAH